MVLVDLGVLVARGIVESLQLSCGVCLNLFILVALGAAGIRWEPPIKLWSVPHPCTGSVTTLKCPIVVRGTPHWWRHEGDYGVPFDGYSGITL